MRHPGIDDRTLDEAGVRLVRSLKQADAVDRVVNDPFLFTRVKARIAVSEAETVTGRFALLGFIARHRSTSAACVIAITGLAVFAAMQMGKRTMSVPDQVAGAPIRKMEPKVDQIAAPKSSQPIVATNDRREQPHFEKAVLRTPVAARKPLPRKRIDAARMPDDQFYAVSYAGDVMDSDSGGRIVRVQMSRSSLLAMGVNVPLENDSDAPVQADLLLGRDGSTRGIRFIK